MNSKRRGLPLIYHFEQVEKVSSSPDGSVINLPPAFSNEVTRLNKFHSIYASQGNTDQFIVYCGGHPPSQIMDKDQYSYFIMTHNYDTNIFLDRIT